MNLWQKRSELSLILIIYLIDIYFVEVAIEETWNKQEESDAIVKLVGIYWRRKRRRERVSREQSYKCSRSLLHIASAELL